MKVIAPVRVRRTYVQKIQARPEDVFPLLCPVRETEWVPGWEPTEVYSNSGHAEPDCVFLTGSPERGSFWVVTGWDPGMFRLEIIKVTPGETVGKIDISLFENEDNGTDAHVTYMYTALSEEGEKFVQSYTEEFFAEFMQYWEEALNNFLGAELP